MSPTLERALEPDLITHPDALTDAASHYEIGWSHGKEKLKSGQYDTHKGSFYVNCQSFYLPSGVANPTELGSHVHTAPNLWPPEALIPGFRTTFEELCTLTIDIGALVARACDQYASKYVQGYEAGYLEHMVKTSATTKARLLHYFPPERSSPQSSSPSSSPSDSSNAPQSENDDNSDSWCASHLDDGCLTALTSALYIDESSPLPSITSTTAIPALPSLSTSPDPAAGLYIRSRTSNVVKVNIPADCLAFQTGEALQLITSGAFRAVPHSVRGPQNETGEGRAVARNTLAIFMQPNVDEVIDKANRMTFGEFANIAVQNHS
jgi:isopenicillin N synthase-like dioxygenase